MTDQEHSNLNPDDPDTTGHSWDGIQEFNNPLPRWWLYTFYITIVWAVIYTVLYPAWPMVSGATAGILGYSTRAEVAEEIERFEALNVDLRTQMTEVELASVTRDDMPELYNYAIQSGASTFATFCSQCHGRGAAGVQASGYPNLLDDDWLWGGSVEEIRATIAHGIRNEDDPDARWSQMTAFDDIFTDDEVGQVVNYVLEISGQDADAALAAEGATLFMDNCAACHGDNAMGDRALGAPNLTDRIWLYGGSADAIEHTVRFARFGVMPTWSERLSEDEIRATAIYVHSLGGGE